MPKKRTKQLRPAAPSDPVTIALSLLERSGPLTSPELARLASLLAARMDPGAITGLAILGRSAILDDHLLAAPASRDESARATLKGLDLLRPIASAKAPGPLPRGLRTAALAQLEAIRTAVVKWPKER
jgi:hypothetical protein